jgi:hypothetical protein
MQAALVYCSPRLMGEKLCKFVFLSGINVSKRARMSKSQMKVMLIAFFDTRGIVHIEFIPQGKIVNQAYYMWKY